MSTEALREVGGILLGAGLTTVTSYLLGHALLARFPRLETELTTAEHVLFSFAAGSACLSGLVFVLCALGLFYDASVWAIAVLAFAAAAIWARRAPRCRAGFRQHASIIWGGFLAVAGLLYGGLYLIHAAAPEISADGVTYHLGLVRRYYGAHGFPTITNNIYAYLSQGAEMLYLFAYAVGRHSAAKLVHFSFLVGGVGAILLLARRFQVWPAGGDWGGPLRLHAGRGVGRRQHLQRLRAGVLPVHDVLRADGVVEGPPRRLASSYRHPRGLLFCHQIHRLPRRAAWVGGGRMGHFAPAPTAA